MDEKENTLESLPLRGLGLINGKLLGDGNLTITENRKPRFRFQHRYADKDWSIYCYEELNIFIPLSPPKYKLDRDTRVKSGYSESIYVQSITSPVFDYLKSQWYSGRTKVVPFDLLKRTLTVESLAWWYQDDGHLTIKNNVLKKLILSTDNFTTEENLGLIKLIKEKFYLSFSLDGQNRLCLYDKPQIMYFLHLVEDYIQPSMIRKLFKFKPETSSIVPLTKRTTIYLPFILQKPTAEIRELLTELEWNKFIEDWFHYFKSLDKQTFPFNFSYQVTLNESELLKINQIQIRTGLGMSDILYYLYKRKDGLP
ncbi:endonuclease [Heyndrickxia sp. MSNUG]|uniref:endonuclease n=1 Tax=Heyndrickxia sp. MSNUG TaxID=3136677 RepID=UPI003C2E7A7C